jgi:hypothetical protein
MPQAINASENGVNGETARCVKLDSMALKGCNTKATTHHQIPQMHDNHFGDGLHSCI